MTTYLTNPTSPDGKHHIRLGVMNPGGNGATTWLDLLARIDTHDSLQRGMNNPYIDRLNQTVYRTEDDYKLHLAHTFRTAAMGEGQLVAVTDSGRYWSSSGVDISGASGCMLTLNKDPLKINDAEDSVDTILTTIQFSVATSGGDYTPYWANAGDYANGFLSVNMANVPPGTAFSALTGGVTYKDESGTTRRFNAPAGVFAFTGTTQAYVAQKRYPNSQCIRFGTDDFLLRGAENGLLVTWPAHKDGTAIPKYVSRWQGNSWLTSQPGELDYSTLAADMTSGAATMTVFAGDGPHFATGMLLIINDSVHGEEIVRVTGAAAGDVVPIARAQNGTVAVVHSIGNIINTSAFMLPTVGTFVPSDYTLQDMAVSGNLRFYVFTDSSPPTVCRVLRLDLATGYSSWLTQEVGPVAAKPITIMCPSPDETTMHASAWWADTSGKVLSRFYTFPTIGTPPVLATKIGSDITGKCVCMGTHGAYVYAGILHENRRISELWRYDGTVWSLFKSFPAGFVIQSLASDGSLLLIGGQQLAAEGNLRGQLYYITGVSASEALGLVGTFGQRGNDGAGRNYDYNVLAMASNGKSFYFSYSYEMGMGRYDTSVGGISRSYSVSRTSSTFNPGLVNNIAVWGGEIYFSILGNGIADSLTGALYRVKTNASTFRSSGIWQSSFEDFGYPTTPKLFTGITIAYNNSHVGVDGNGVPLLPTLSTKVALDADYSNLYTVTVDPVDVYRRGNITIANYPFLQGQFDGFPSTETAHTGVHAYSLAVELTLGGSPGFGAYPVNQVAPQIYYVSGKAMPLLFPPGGNRAAKIWKLPLVGAYDQTMIDGLPDPVRFIKKLRQLRSWADSGQVMRLQIVGEDIEYNVIVNDMSEVSTAPGVPTDNAFPNGTNVVFPDLNYEPTVQLELMEIH